MKKKTNKPSLIDRVYIYFMRKSKRINNIINTACGEAYDLGYDAGVREMANKQGGKKYVKKVEKIIKNRYKTKNGQIS